MNRPGPRRRRTIRTFSAAAVLALAVAAPAATAQAPNDDRPDAAEKISDTWSRTVPVTDPPDPKFGRWRAWVQDGWLLAERRTGDDEVEWKVVLAKVEGDEAPEVTVNRIPVGVQVVRRDSKGGETVVPAPSGPIPGGLRLSYRGGRYFIRDDLGSLRCLRERKADDQPWPHLEAPPRDERPQGGSGAAGGGPRSSFLNAQVSNSWLTVTAGPQRPAGRRLDRSMTGDCLVRLYHTDLQEPSGLKFLGRMGAPRVSYGEWFVVDDGELLVAERVEAARLAAVLQIRAQHNPALAARLAMKKLGGSPPPELSGETCLNAGSMPTWNELRGKPVLLVLFDLKQPSFVPLVPPLLAFAQTYDKQGLVVLGVHAHGPRDEIEKRLAEERIAFPVLIDDGKNAERYAIEFSACVLIDRQGKVASVYKDSLAPPAEIEKLLEASRPSSP